jgi:hypothetical protein
MDKLAIITAGPSAMEIETPLGEPVVCVNMAGAIHECDWLAFHDSRILDAATLPRRGYITSRDCMTEHFGCLDKLPAGRNFIETRMPWAQSFNFTFPIMLATILAHWMPKRVTVYGLDMTPDKTDCAGHHSGSRTVKQWNLELAQLACIWSPVVDVDDSCRLDSETRAGLTVAGATNGRWHDY